MTRNEVLYMKYIRRPYPSIHMLNCISSDSTPRVYCYMSLAIKDIFIASVEDFDRQLVHRRLIDRNRSAR